MELLPSYDQIGVSPPPPWANANPASGIQGSIINAIVFNALQNEIVNAQGGASLTQNPADYTQLNQAIRSQLSAYYVDGGAVNAPSITPANPAVTALADGMFFRVKMANAPTAAATFYVNSLTAPIVRRNGLPLVGGEWNAGDVIGLVYSTAAGAFQICGLTLSDIALNFVKSLAANATYYVNTSSGSDSNNGLTSGAAFATIQKALDVCTTFNLNGFNVTINVAAGTYGQCQLPSVNGSGTIELVGTGTPVITSSVGSAVIGSGVGTLGSYIFNGFEFGCTGANSAAGDPGCGVLCNSAALFIQLVNTTFAECVASWAEATNGGEIQFTGTLALTAGSSSAAPGFFANIRGYISSLGSSPPIITIPNSFTVGVFIAAASLGVTNFTYGSLTGSGTVTGARYSSNSNSVIATNGGGASYYPGSSSGGIATGGQYV